MTPAAPRASSIPTLTETVAAIAAGRSSPREVAEASLARIRATEPSIHAWAHLDPARVQELADSCASAPAAPLRGVGIGIKDIIDTADLPTEIGTPIHAGRRPSRDAACVKRLHAAGAYAFGKTVSTAFAFIDAGPTRNPWSFAHTPGGSSSGSAAAVAAGQVCAAIGTQTNGSVVRPAAFCGVVGFKPTCGLLEFSGAHVFSATFDTLGTFTRTVRDAALLASVLAPAGRIASEPVALTQAPRLAFLSAFPWSAPVPGAADALAVAAVQLRDAGATVIPVGFPDAWHDAHRVHRTIMLYEGARALGALQAQHRALLSAKTNAALDEGHAIGETDYRAALSAREQAIAYFADWLSPYDAVLTPAAPGGAPAGLESTGDPGCCTLWSLVGFPAAALPTGLDESGLPLGLQLAARADADDALLRVATWCEAALGFDARVAPFAEEHRG
jgi:Asp-tRNA(Asn)/Glu-tRNA(Gln) amidotransferase A subunit family amidase